MRYTRYALRNFSELYLWVGSWITARLQFANAIWLLFHRVNNLDLFWKIPIFWIELVFTNELNHFQTLNWIFSKNIHHKFIQRDFLIFIKRRQIWTLSSFIAALVLLHNKQIRRNLVQTVHLCAYVYDEAAQNITSSAYVRHVCIGWRLLHTIAHRYWPCHWFRYTHTHRRTHPHRIVVNE